MEARRSKFGCGSGLNFGFGESGGWIRVLVIEKDVLSVEFRRCTVEKDLDGRKPLNGEIVSAAFSPWMRLESLPFVVSVFSLRSSAAWEGMSFKLMYSLLLYFLVGEVSNSFSMTWFCSDCSMPGKGRVFGSIVESPFLFCNNCARQDLLS